MPSLLEELIQTVKESSRLISMNIAALARIQILL